MTKQFTAEHYQHIKEMGFKPGICPMCLEIDAILLELSIITELQEGKYCKGGV